MKMYAQTNPDTSLGVAGLAIWHLPRGLMHLWGEGSI